MTTKDAEQVQAEFRCAIHEASHGVCYHELADGVEYRRDDLILTMYWDNGICKGECIYPRLPGVNGVVATVAGTVGENVISFAREASIEEFQAFVSSDWKLPFTDRVAPEFNTQEKLMEAAQRAAEILVRRQRAVQLLAMTLIQERAVGASLIEQLIESELTPARS